eukprot:gene8593-8775_t
MCSSLIPHVTQLLGTQAPSWLHSIVHLHSANSISNLQEMISHPSRYDCTYLVAALHRLAELAMQAPHQQQLDVLQAAPAPSVISQLIGSTSSGSRRVRRLKSTVPRQQLVDPEAVARNCCSVVWAAAELGYTSNPELLRVFVDGFLTSMPAVAGLRPPDGQLAALLATLQSKVRGHRLEAVQAILGQLPEVDQVLLEGSTEDGWFCRDLDVLVLGTPATLLLLDDEADGGWVGVVSWQQLRELQETDQLQQEYLQEVLWPLLQQCLDQQGEAAGGYPGDGRQLSFVAGTPVAAAAAGDLLGQDV